MGADAAVENHAAEPRQVAQRGADAGVGIDEALGVDSRGGVCLGTERCPQVGREQFRERTSGQLLQDPGEDVRVRGAVVEDPSVLAVLAQCGEELSDA